MHTFVHLVHVYGLLAVAGVVGLECVGLPLPGETALLAAAVFAGTKHELNIFAVVLTAAGAATLGRMIGYVVGHEFGYWVLLRYGGYVGLNEARIKLGQYLFLKHGGKIVLIAQFIPVLRTFAGIFAGANRMPWRQFMLANICGAGLWAAGFGFSAYMLGRQFEKVAGSLVLILVVLAVIGFVVSGAFVRRHEAQLVAKAERALPGPLQLP